jgi:predicted dehydrogenase
LNLGASVNEPIPLVLMGCGAIAQAGHLPAIARRHDVRLVAVMDRDASAAGQTAAATGATVVAEPGQAVALGARAAIIATPPDVTPRLTIEAVQRGLDVLCEKPMALGLDDAQRVVEAADATGRVVQVGFKNRFSPLVGRARELLRAGRLGSPVVALMSGLDEPVPHADPRHDAKILQALAQGSAFVHDGAHLADYLAFLLDRHPLTVAAVGIASAGAPSENFVSALVRDGSGAIARLEIGWRVPTTSPDEFRLLGPQGVITIDREAGTLELISATDVERFAMERDWNDECFDRQLAQFVDCVRTRRQPAPSARDGLASLRLCDAVTKSLSSRATVELEPSGGVVDDDS